MKTYVVAIGVPNEVDEKLVQGHLETLIREHEHPGWKIAFVQNLPDGYGVAFLNMMSDTPVVPEEPEPPTAPPPITPEAEQSTTVTPPETDGGYQQPGFEHGRNGFET